MTQGLGLYHSQAEACAVKVKWLTRERATKHLIGGKKARRYLPSHVVYYCGLCCCYHIGRKK